MVWTADLELRKAANRQLRLRGRFPYGKPAVLSDGGRTGRPKKEIIAPLAFNFRVKDPEAEIHLLVGHSYDRPLASKKAGTLTFDETEEALGFEATISEEMQQVGYVRDFIGGFNAGLIRGISPGFRIPPKRVVPVAEKTEEEDPSLGLALIRTIFQALLFELSFVTAPAYPDTETDMSDEEEDGDEDDEDRAFLLRDPPDAALRRALNRWRA